MIIVLIENILVILTVVRIFLVPKYSWVTVGIVCSLSWNPFELFLLSTLS